MSFYVLAIVAKVFTLVARPIGRSLKTDGYALFLFPDSFLSSVRAQSDYHLQIVKPTVGGFAGQRFLCARPYSISECDKQVAILQAALRRFPIEGLGPWTWVLVRSEDRKPILTRVRMDPNSPAFSILERRQTFLEEALLVANPKRQLELLNR